MPSNLENKTSDEHHHMTYHTVSLFITALKKLNLVISGHGKLLCNFRFAGCMWKWPEPCYTDQYISRNTHVLGHIQECVKIHGHIQLKLIQYCIVLYCIRNTAGCEDWLSDLSFVNDQQLRCWRDGGSQGSFSKQTQISLNIIELKYSQHYYFWQSH